MDVNQLIQIIQNEYENGDKDKAIQFTRSLGSKVKEMPQMAEVYGICLFYEGRILVDTEKLKEAEKVLLNSRNVYLDNSLEKNGYFWSSELALADIYFKSNKNEEALSIYNSILNSEELGDDLGLNTKLNHKFAVIAERQRKYEKAINYYEKYLDSYLKMHGQKSSIYIDFYKHKEKLKLALEAKKANYSGDMMQSPHLVGREFSEGGGTIMDIQYAKYLVSELPDPMNIDIEGIINKSKRIEVFSEGQVIGYIEKDQIKKELIDKLRIEENSGGHKMCLSELILICTDDTEKIIDEIEYLGEGMIRIKEKWKPDAKLMKPNGFKNWVLNNMTIKNSQLKNESEEGVKEKKVWWKFWN